MLKMAATFELLTTIGAVTTAEEADTIFRQYMPPAQYLKMSKITAPKVRTRIANAMALCRPASVFINTGSAEDRQFIRELAIRKKEEAPLAMGGHTIHFDLPEEQGRLVNQTCYIVDKEEHVSTLAHRIDRAQAMAEIQKQMTGIMKDMTMIIGFYLRGPVGAPVSNPALEITSSAYVSHSADLLYRNAFETFDREVNRLGHFFTNIHSEGLNRPIDLPDARILMDRKFQTTYSWKCTYAGNTLLLKKGNHRFAVDKAVFAGNKKELAEHMFITGIKGPEDRITWIAGAAPSGCGKTTTAMAGHMFVGDDLAQMWIAQDGSIRSINPECGIFGIVADVNRTGDPMLIDALRNPGCEVIWSNVLVDENNVPHWEGSQESQPDSGINFQGPWKQGMKDEQGKKIPMSHPNARCTLSATGLKNYAGDAEKKDGVITRIFTYSGRDSDTMPPVRVARTADHGVVTGACIVSEATATEVGARGIKRAPWANAPFIPGTLGDYMDLQFSFFNSIDIDPSYRPVLAGLNFFLTREARGGSSNALLGEKRDVKVWLAWLERYAHNEVDYIETPIGNLPCYDDLRELFSTIVDKPYPQDLYDKQFSLYIDNIVFLIELQEKAYAEEINIPGRFFEILSEQKKELLALKAASGAIVPPGTFSRTRQSKIY